MKLEGRLAGWQKDRVVVWPDAVVDLLEKEEQEMPAILWLARPVEAISPQRISPEWSQLFRPSRESDSNRGDGHEEGEGDEEIDFHVESTPAVFGPVISLE